MMHYAEHLNTSVLNLEFVSQHSMPGFLQTRTKKCNSITGIKGKVYTQM